MNNRIKRKIKGIIKAYGWGISVEEFIKGSNKGIREEGLKRGYKFKDLGLPSYDKYMVKIPLNQGQLNYEFGNLQRKLYKRNKNKYEANKERFLNEHTIQPHPLFYVVEGNIEKWEKIK